MLRNPVDMLPALHGEHIANGNEDITDFTAALDAEPERRAGRRIPPHAHLPQGLWYTDVPRYAEQLESSTEAADGINRINDEEGVRWLYSFLSADRRKTYCLYEAPSPDAIRRAAVRAGVPADVVVEMVERVLPDGTSARI